MMSTWASSLFGVTKTEVTGGGLQGEKNTELNSVEQMTGFFWIKIMKLID